MRESPTVILPEKDDPKAIVMLFNWVGALPKHVLKYSELYLKSAAVVAVHVDMTTQSFKVDSSIRQYVQDGLAEVAELLDKHSGLPLIVHAFSNGGGFCVEQLEKILPSLAPNIQQSYKDGAVIFDSAPAWIDWETIQKVLEAAVPNIAVRCIVTAVIFTYYWSVHFTAKIGGNPDIGQVYWDNLKLSKYGTRQAFVYSTADQITSYEKLEEFIEHRKRAEGVCVTVLRFEDSGHVMHLRKHRKEYQSLVNTVLKECGVSVKE